ncbi:MAG: hypothetical protein SFV81_15020 [Pirellulaceae bacterium]|nr:hypothetical protein [Pirellulaceae bacterium]
MNPKSNPAITWCDAIDRPWLKLEPYRIGDIPAGLGTPAQYILLEIDGQPAIRVDAYPSSNECFAFQDAILWHGFLVVGWGHCVYLIDVDFGVIIKHQLGSYFGHLYAQQEYLLVASSEQLVNIRQDGRILWTSDTLGIDGVIVLDVSNGIITGDGEWDPPGDWRPFRIFLDSGLDAQ